MRHHPNRVILLGPSHRMARPPQPEMALFYIGLDIVELWNCLAPNPAI